MITSGFDSVVRVTPHEVLYPQPVLALPSRFRDGEENIVVVGVELVEVNVEVEVLVGTLVVPSVVVEEDVVAIVVEVVEVVFEVVVVAIVEVVVVATLWLQSVVPPDREGTCEPTTISAS